MTTVKEPNQGLRRHKLLTAELRSQLPKLYAQDGKGDEATAYVKFFSPYTGYTFYVTEFDGDDTLFGWGGFRDGNDEWGYASLNELASTTLFGGVPAIERDCGWEARTMTEARGS